MKLSLPLLASLLLSAVALNANIILEHTFDGDTSNLNSSPVDQAAAGIDTAWTAADGVFLNDGTISGVGGAHRSAFLSLGDVINNTRGVHNGIFILTIELGGLPSGGGWLGSGFAQGLPGTDESNFVNGNGITSIMWDQNPYGALRVWNGPNLSASVGTIGTTADPVALVTTLDLTTWDGSDSFGTVTYSYNDGEGETVRSLGSGNSTFDTLMLSSFAANGQLISVSITQVPEAGTVAMLLGGLFALTLVARRRLR